eukprot:CAMPEP_0197707942 /NCGR_PEP_ID=MMETSP1338-20131121/127703_1 /TAXON_ID=43686 ORGANISM="Pelagodinium beii, Strain RCC1491" /NCGR_SAMPLE_ID=MMETSP1338 /ASSEMBLY_ACC=CAM_ASM_000754 /LENGTH=287 /DNA_ID=CAMNT_0043291869 /DNA_START=797 /DNA_END=1661 /DNA_ORIENTATION=-
MNDPLTRRLLILSCFSMKFDEELDLETTSPGGIFRRPLLLEGVAVPNDALEVSSSLASEAAEKPTVSQIGPEPRTAQADAIWSCMVPSSVVKEDPACKSAQSWNPAFRPSGGMKRGSSDLSLASSADSSVGALLDLRQKLDLVEQSCFQVLPRIQAPLSERGCGSWRRLLPENPRQEKPGRSNVAALVPAAKLTDLLEGETCDAFQSHCSHWQSAALEEDSTAAAEATCPPFLETAAVSAAALAALPAPPHGASAELPASSLAALSGLAHFSHHFLLGLLVPREAAL